MKKIILKENEKVVLPILWAGEENEINYDVYLDGDGSEISIIGLLLGAKEDALNIFINLTHNAKHTKSEIILKGALAETSKVNFEGLVKINPKAKGTNAWLACHLLLLSDKAKGRAIPSLEILENDIKAGHATTVGRVNDIELFYLMSRGISKEKAKQLIVQGFLQSVLKKFPTDVYHNAEKLLENFKV